MPENPKPIHILYVGIGGQKPQKIEILSKTQTAVDKIIVGSGKPTFQTNPPLLPERAGSMDDLSSSKVEPLTYPSGDKSRRYFVTSPHSTVTDLEFARWDDDGGASTQGSP